MTTNNKNIIISKLSDYYNDEELAVIIYCLDEGILDLFDICNLDTFEELEIANPDDIDINRNCVNALYDEDKPDILVDTNCGFVSVDNTMYKYDYIVTDDLDDAETAVKEVLKNYAKYNGLDEFDIDITQYLDEDYFKDWYFNALKEEAENLSTEPSDNFPNGLYEVMYNQGELDDTDFRFNDEIGDYDTNRPIIPTNELIELYADDNSTNAPINDIINLYIDEVGEDVLKQNVDNGTIDIDWDKLTTDCINTDGIETYLSVDSRVGTVDIDNTDYYIYLEHTNA